MGGASCPDIPRSRYIELPKQLCNVKSTFGRESLLHRGKMPLPHIIQECTAADSQARYTAKLILPLVLAELNSYGMRGGSKEFDIYSEL